MKGVQFYELFGGIALKNHAFSFSLRSTCKIDCLCCNCHSSTDMQFKKSQHTAATHAPALTAHTMLLFNRSARSRATLDDHRFPLLHLLSGTLFQMMSGVSITVSIHLWKRLQEMTSSKNQEWST